MSNFACEKCGVWQYDSDRGYVAGCCHFPPHNNRHVTLRFGDDGERDRVGWYDGSFYVSKEGQRQQKAVHPTEWFEIGTEVTK